MKPVLHYGGTLMFYLLIIVSAILVPDVSIVFDFVAAFAVSAIVFLFPGLFYYKTANKFGKSNKHYLNLSYFYMATAVLNCVVSLSSTIMGLLA